MNRTGLEPCPGCQALLAPFDGPTHRYIGASPACWAIFSALGVGAPSVAPSPLRELLVDAYAAQHPGLPSNQAIQSVAVHLIALYGVLVRDHAPADAIALRTRPLREQTGPKRGRFYWLTPPDLSRTVTVATIAAATTPAARAALVDDCVHSVWAAWAPQYEATIAAWYERYVVPTRL
jgi:hypothetical protein